MTTTTVTASVERVTPEQAEAWLGDMQFNRPMNQRKADEHSRAMKAGEWRLNGQSIIFGPRNELLDGQHRLWGCFDSGVPFTTVVVRGVDPEAFRTIDQGRRRTPSDVLYIAGYRSKDNNRLHAISVVCLRYLSGNLTYHPDIKDVEDFNRRHPEVRDWTDKAASLSGPFKGWGTPVGAVCFLGSHRHQNESELFLHKFRTGEGLDLGSPILALRNRVAANQQQRTDRRIGSKDAQMARFQMTVLAWNAFVTHRDLRVFKLRSDGTMPRIHGGMR